MDESAAGTAQETLGSFLKLYGCMACHDVSSPGH